MIIILHLYIYVFFLANVELLTVTVTEILVNWKIMSYYNWKMFN